MATAAPAQNPLAGLASLLQTIGGTRSTTNTSPGDITALQQVFNQGQQFDPNALLQTIFQQAGGQIPGLQRAFGNAIGARSGNNSAASAALQQLLMQTSLAGQQQVSNQVLQNQQQQGNVAANIAQATKGTTQTQKSGTDMGNVAKLLGLWQLAGQTGLIDKIGKGLGVGGTSGGSGASTGTASAPTGSASAPAPATVQSAPAPMAMQSATSSPVYGGALSTGVPLGTTIDTGLLDQPGMGSMDWANGATLADGFNSYSDMFADQANNLATMEGIDSMDALMGVTDGFGTIEGGGSNFIDDILGFLGFADGGLVGRDGQKPGADEEAVEDSTMRRFDRGNTVNVPLDLLRELMPQFADGGIVRGPRRVNTTQTANPLTAVASNTATGGTRATAPVTQRPATPAPAQRPQQQQERQRQEMDFGAGTVDQAAYDGPVASASDLAALDAALGLAGRGFAGTAGAMLGGTVLGPVGALVGRYAASQFASQAIANNTATTGIDLSTLGAGGFTSNADYGLTTGTADSADYGFDSNADYGLASTDTTGTSGSSIGLGSGFGGGLGLSTGGGLGLGTSGGLGLGGVGESGDYGGGADVGFGSGADYGSGDLGMNFKNGGEVDGPGTGTSDSIIARLSDGEYVIPADVVDTVGVEFFDALRAAIHQPAGMRR